MSILEPPPVLDDKPAKEPFNLRRWLFTPNDKYVVGTLKYTGFGLIMVFVWLLWGDFIFTVLDGSVPGILPLKLNLLGTGDVANQVINKTFGYSVAFLFAPMVSVKSDRTRTRFGRRIPYLFWSTPFVGLFLILMGLYQPIVNMITHGESTVRFLGMTFSQTGVTVAVFGALIIGWDFANIFVNTVYWYLFNDVVPSAYMGRFMSLFRIVGTLAGMGYARWVFPHALDHFSVIFVTAGIAYVVGFTLMCVFVREGNYPPPVPMAAEGARVELPAGKTAVGRFFIAIARWLLGFDRVRQIVAAAVVYARECFTHRLYWMFFLANSCTFMAGLTGNFGNIRNTRVLGLTLAQIGMVKIYKDWGSLALHYPAGWLSDKWHPLRVYVITHLLYIMATASACVWIFRDFGAAGNYRYYFWTTLLFEPMYALANAAEIPMYMRLLPKEKYGQFCSANGMVRAFTMIFGSIAAGYFIDAMGHWFGMRRYTFIPAWALMFQLIAAVFLIQLWKEWKRHGGNTHYVPPGTERTEPLGAFPVIQK